MDLVKEIDKCIEKISVGKVKLSSELVALRPPSDFKDGTEIASYPKKNIMVTRHYFGLEDQYIELLEHNNALPVGVHKELGELMVLLDTIVLKVIKESYMDKTIPIIDRYDLQVEQLNSTRSQIEPLKSTKVHLTPKEGGIKRAIRVLKELQEQPWVDFVCLDLLVLPVRG